ncbi:winged helix DNA-binding domain-containing protein, partial [Ascobolus immersus RN42]
MREEDYTQEDLQKPGASYVYLIYEAISNSETKRMSLSEIYRAIQRKYPYFKFRVGTNGWQSSIRHNLGQNSAFEKVEKDGKGYLWGITPGATVEKERKKR